MRLCSNLFYFESDSIIDLFQKLSYYEVVTATMNFQSGNILLAAADGFLADINKGMFLWKN